MTIAWHVQNFSRGAPNTFKDLAYYINKWDEPVEQTAEEVIAVFEHFARKGLATIRVRERGLTEALNK